MGVVEMESQQRSSPDVVVDAIVSGIYSGRMVPGQRLVEADITRNLGVSRGPVREALKRLAAEGMVTLNPHRGAYVRELTRKEVHDTLVVLEAIVGLVAHLAANNIDTDDYRSYFEASHSNLMAAGETGDSMAQLDARRRYYGALGRIAENLELTRLMPLMQIHLLRLQFQSYFTPKQREMQFKDYAAVTEAVLNGDSRRAERLMKLHIRRTRLLISRLPEEAFATS